GEVSFEDVGFSYDGRRRALEGVSFTARTLVWREAVRGRVPAVVHADGTGRLQSVTPERNPAYAALIAAFAERTGVPCRPVDLAEHGALQGGGGRDP
ncbi:carbamoyltransferase C-terminal domain-containing protein, partial [Methylobacterium nigriterrae]|uniref:carbamoyltransferase C-terminal domain-containing protein n=1 Tax=Methylobacterium nigriterrae TaxID=3127512 RepID=UPI003013DD38